MKTIYLVAVVLVVFSVAQIECDEDADEGNGPVQKKGGKWLFHKLKIIPIWIIFIIYFISYLFMIKLYY